MRGIKQHIKWIMLISGILTCTMIYAVISPGAALLGTFGVSIEGELAGIVVRSWGVLITLVGAMLIYAAFHPEVRGLVAFVAAVSKLAYASLVVAFGAQFLSRAWPVVGFDSLVAIVLFAYVLSLSQESGQVRSEV